MCKPKTSVVVNNLFDRSFLKDPIQKTQVPIIFQVDPKSLYEMTPTKLYASNDTDTNMHFTFPLTY